MMSLLKIKNTNEDDDFEEKMNLILDWLNIVIKHLDRNDK